MVGSSRRLGRYLFVLGAVVCAAGLAQAYLMPAVPQVATPGVRPRAAEVILRANDREVFHDAVLSPDGKVFYLVRTEAAVNLWALLVYEWPWVLTAILVGAGVWLVRRFVRQFGVRGEVGQPMCRGCRYQLTGVVSDHCPECGMVLTAENRIVGLSFRSVGLRFAVQWLAIVLAVVLLHTIRLPRSGWVSTWMRVDSVWLARQFHRWQTPFPGARLDLINWVISVEERSSSSGEIRRTLLRKHWTPIRPIFDFGDGPWIWGQRASLIPSDDGGSLGVVAVEDDRKAGQLIVLDLATGKPIPFGNQKRLSATNVTLIRLMPGNRLYATSSNEIPGLPEFVLLGDGTLRILETTDREAASFKFGSGDCRVFVREGKGMPAFSGMKPDWHPNVGVMAGRGTRYVFLKADNSNVLVRDLKEDKWVARCAKALSDGIHAVRVSDGGSRALVYGEYGRDLAVYDLRDVVAAGGGDAVE